MSAVEFDLSKADFVEPLAMLHLVALVAHRTGLSESSLIKLPKERRVRDVLRLWDFAPCVKQLTGIPLSALVLDTDRHYFGEGQRYYPPTSDPPLRMSDPLRKLISELYRNRFFALTVYKLDPTTASVGRMIESEWTRWRSDVVLALLDAALRGRGEDFPRVPLFELLANVIQHPNAHHAVVVSKVDELAEGRSDGSDHSLSVAVWDDGVPIVNTLRKVLDRGEPIRRPGPPEVDVEYTVKADGWTPSREVYNGKWEPDSQSSDAELMLGSLLPGITQKIANPRPAVSHPDIPDSVTLRDDGYGLHSLCRTVIDTFDGKIAVRSGTLFMNIRRNPVRGGSPSDYRAKVVDWGAPTFPGNMFTLRLPFRSGT
jgi:hypothetical protein